MFIPICAFSHSRRRNTTNVQRFHQKKFKKSFHSQTTDRKIVNTGNEFQIAKGSDQNINSLNFLEAQQNEARAGTANKTNKSAVFDKLDIKIHFVEIDGTRYSKVSINFEYIPNEYLDQ